MSATDLVFDPSKKKKKKKKVTIEDGITSSPNPVDATSVDPEDAAISSTTSVPPRKEANVDNDAVRVTTVEADAADVDDLDLDLNLSKKKKKKPKTVRLELDEIDEPAADDGVTVPEDELDVDLGLGRKKKKPRGPKVTKEELLKADDGASAGVAHKDADGVSLDASNANELNSLPSSGTQDYSYEELLKRVFDTIRERNPEMMSGEKKRVVMKPPQLMRVGSKKTAFVNLLEISKHLKRQLKHVLQYLLSELGTTGSIDANSQIILRGRFQGKHIEPLLRNYVKEFVMCHTCRSQDTELMKDTRLVFLNCNTCGSRCSVTSIKSGYQALTGRRAAMRAKTT